MKQYLLITSLLISSFVYSQDALKIQPAGRRLQEFYLSMDVEKLWLAQHHINWQTGEPDMPESVHGDKTHCSAFIAAACQRLNIYLLRPPEHSQILLANAQYDWLNDTEKARKEGWIKLEYKNDLYKEVQKLANQGKVIVAIYKNTDNKKPGHAALVMPATLTDDQLADAGPELITAGTHNYNYIQLKKGFRNHITSWPTQEIAFFAHDAVLQ